MCNTVKCVEEHSKLIGTGDIAPAGLELEPPTPDEAKPKLDTLGLTPKTPLE